MQEVFKKILKKLNARKITYVSDEYFRGFNYGVDAAIEIVKQAAKEYVPDMNVGMNGWIPVSERLPEEAFGCLVTIMDCEQYTQTDFENILPYFVGYDGNRWNDADGEKIPFEVIAWRKLPEPYKPKGE